MENKHINMDTLSKFHSQQLKETEYFVLLEHISNCTHCADLFAESFHDEMLIAAPKNLKEQILIEVSHVKTISPKKQLFFYSIRVCAGMCGALLLLFTTFGNKLPSIPYSTGSTFVSFDFLESLSSTMNHFTFHINETMDAIITSNPNQSGGNQNDQTKR